MTQQDLLGQARQGNVEAIATLLNRALQSKGITAKVGIKGDCLYVSLVAEQVPPQRVFAPFIHQAILKLRVKPVRSVRIYGRQTGQDSPTWYQEVDLSNPLQPPTQPIDQPPAPSQPAPSAAGIANEAVVEPVVNVAPIAAAQPEPPPSPVEATPPDLMAVGTNIQPSVYYEVQRDSQAGDRVERVPIANQPQPRLRSLPVLELPEPFPNLVGRETELAEAIAALQAHQPVEFYGPNGIGRTSLLRHLAHHSQVLSLFPAGIIYLSGAGKSLADLMQQLFDLFYESPLPLRLTETQLCNALQGKRAFILLDDHDLPPDGVERLVDDLPDFGVVLASAERCLGTRGKAIAVHGLASVPSLTLIERELARALTPQERLTAEDLHQSLDGQPSLLVQSAVCVREQRTTLEELVQRLQPAFPQRSLLRQIRGLLSVPQRTTLESLAAMGGATLSAGEVGEIAALADPASGLQNLRREHLLTAIGNRYRPEAALMELLLQESDLSPWMERILSYFLPWVEQHQAQPQQLLPSAEPLLKTIEWAVNTSRWGEVLALGQPLAAALMTGKQWDRWEKSLQWQLQASRALGNTSIEALILHQLGTRSLCLDDPTAAHNYLTQALRLRENLGEPTAAEVTRHNLDVLQSLPPAPTPAYEVAALEPDPYPVPIPHPESSGFRVPLVVLAVGVLGVAAAIGLLIGNVARYLQTGNGTRGGVPPTESPSPSASPTGEAGSLSLSDNSIDFGKQPAGNRDVPYVLTLTNNGSTPIMFNEITLAGANASSFAILPGGCAKGTSLKAGESCEIQVNFTPQKAQTYQAELLIAHSATGEPQRIPLKGLGTTSAEASIDVSAVNVQFGDVPLNSRGGLRQIIIGSNGVVPLQIRSIQLSTNQPEFAIERNTCPNNGTLPANQRCVVYLRFKPSQKGDFRNTLVINHSAAGSPAKVALSGTGAGTATSAVPEILEFRVNPPEVRPGQRARLCYGITNATHAFIRPGIGDVQLTEKDCIPITPSRDTTYTLVAIGQNGRRVQQQATVRVTGNPAQIIEFKATPATIAPDGKSQLCYEVTNATSASIQPDVGEVETTGSNCRTVSPNQTAPYTLTAIGNDGSYVRRTVTVTVEAAKTARILLFKADTTRVVEGKPFELCYGVTDAVRAEIQPDIGNVAVSDNRCVLVNAKPVISPPSTTYTYTLSAVGQDNQPVTQDVSIEVTPAAQTPPAN
ncbi:MAG: choice-of-anchor D domain-containing protein [Scytolyngbya sp. HA4215-MV1]|jgi:hypothetical protein|nr:choice-of-anchor D domain-containing protein [Scytolyngbya sp. HA4215-MV1]